MSRAASRTHASGRYSPLKPTDRSAFLRKVLRSYALEDTLAFEGTPLVTLAAESNSSLIFILALIEEAARLTGFKAALAEADGRLNRR